MLPPNAASASIDSERIRFESEKPGAKVKESGYKVQDIKLPCRERERELEKIHRRSRELMLSPRFHDSMAARDASMDRRMPRAAMGAAPSAAVDSDHSVASSVGSGVAVESWKPMPPPPPLPPHPPPPPHHHHHHQGPLTAPPPLPPRIHSPPNGNGMHSSRYGALPSERDTTIS